MRGQWEWARTERALLPKDYRSHFRSLLTLPLTSWKMQMEPSFPPLQERSRKERRRCCMVDPHFVGKRQGNSVNLLSDQSALRNKIPSSSPGLPFSPTCFINSDRSHEAFCRNSHPRAAGTIPSKRQTFLVTIFFNEYF